MSSDDDDTKKLLTELYDQAFEAGRIYEQKRQIAQMNELNEILQLVMEQKGGVQ